MTGSGRVVDRAGSLTVDRAGSLTVDRVGPGSLTVDQAKSLTGSGQYPGRSARVKGRVEDGLEMTSS